MIERIFGKVIKLEEDTVVLENLNIGYKMFISKHTKKFITLGNSLTLFISSYHHSDGFKTYFGFYDEDERELFERLLKINGVGGSIGLSLLIDSPEKVLEAIRREDFEFFYGYGFKEKTITMVFKHFRK
jgi:holliday junction DNA helicase RuvA